MTSSSLDSVACKEAGGGGGGGGCNNPLTMHRFDFFLISDTLQFSVHSCEMLNPLQSHHSPIKIKFKSLNTMKGKDCWKFNNSLLDDNIFVQNMKSKINKTIPIINSYYDPRVGWEYSKYRVKGICKGNSN